MPTFAYGAASKGLLIWTGLASFIASTFNKKHYFHLQLVPHITRDHQIWRLITRNLAFTNSIDLFVSILLLYNTSATLERRFGTAKFVSFAIVSSAIGTALEVVALGLFQKLGIEYLPAGPFTLVFSLLYTYSRCVPSAYTYKISGLSFSSKSLFYLLSLQLVFALPPNSAVSAGCGLLAGALYRRNFLGSRQWRVPGFIQKLGQKFLMPVLETTRMARRSTRVSLDETDETVGSGFGRRSGPATPTAATGGSNAGNASSRQGAISEVVQTFASTRSASAPSREAVAQLRAMFPRATEEQVTSALQRGGNDVNRSVEYLL